MYKRKMLRSAKKKSPKGKICRRIKIKIKILHMVRNDPWSDHPKTQFLGLFILFLYKLEPDLRYIL